MCYKTVRTFLIILITVCGIRVSSFSQLLTGNNVSITVTGGAQLTVKGDVQNNSGTTINNNGTIDLSGNWTNNAGNNCFGTSTGTVIFNGANQNIGGTNSTTFNNLQLAGTGAKILMQNISAGGANAAPAGVLDLTSCLLDLNSNTLTITNSNSNAINYTTGFILSEDADNSSKVTWQINSVTGAHSIPFGNVSSVQMPFTFNLTSGNAGDVTVSTYPTAPDNTPYPVTPVLVTNVQNNSGADNSANTVDRFWEVDPTGSPVASLTFTYAPAENAAAGNTNIRGHRWNLPSQDWENALAGQSNPTSQSVFIPDVTTFGPWALALESNPLRIELPANIFENASNILIYPNPSDGIFNIVKKDKAELELFIYDIEGRLVWKTRMSDLSMLVDLQNFRKGVYNLHSEAEGINKNFRIVIQ